MPGSPHHLLPLPSRVPVPFEVMVSPVLSVKVSATKGTFLPLTGQALMSSENFKAATRKPQR